MATTGGQLSNLTQGNTYTLSYTITLSASGTVTINNDLYSGGAVDSNNLLISQTGTTSSSPVTTFDALGFGWRYTGPSAANSIDVSSVTVSDNIASVPEPSLFAAAGLAATSLALRFRRPRS